MRSVIRLLRRARRIISTGALLLTGVVAQVDGLPAFAASSVSVVAWTCPGDLPAGTTDRSILSATCVVRADGVTFALTAGGLTRRRVVSGGQPAIWPAAAGSFQLSIDDPKGEPAVVVCDQAGVVMVFSAANGMIQGALGESENLSCEWFRLLAPAGTGSIGEAGANQSPTASSAIDSTGAPEAREFSEKIDIGGRSLFVSCSGTSQMTIVLEAGGPDGFSDRWPGLRALLPADARVCMYDRAGLGQSDPAPEGARTIQDSVNDLRALVLTGRLGCPCVFVGESWGGNIVRLYAGQYPADVSGMVLVDSIPPGFVEGFLSLVPSDTPGFSALMGAGNAERMDQLRSFRQSDAASIPPVMPVVVITHGLLLGFPISFPVDQLEAVWRSGQEKLAEDLHASLVIAERSSNSVLRDQPDVVAAALQTVAGAVLNPALPHGSVVIHRLDGAGQPLPGACFQIYVDAGNGVHGEYRGAACDADVDGANDGVIFLSPIGPGAYVLQEAKPPDGLPAAPDQSIVAAGLATYTTVQPVADQQSTVTVQSISVPQPTTTP